MASLGLNNGKFVELESDDDVDYELATHDRLFGSHINAIPIQSAVQGPRLFYGARFENQALPLKDPEVPLVQNQDQDTGLSFDKLFGKYAGALESDDDYDVLDVDPDQIVLKNAKGEKVVKELYNNTPFNRKTSIHNTPLVKPGDRVSKGQVLAKSNYTDDSGTLAMGKNALVGLVAYKGHSMDDAIAISQSFANKLTSEHSETHGVEFDHNTKLNKNHFQSLFPQNYTKEQLDKIDDDGVVKPGTILKPGDPIFLTTKPRTINSASFTSGKLTKGLAMARQDASSKWTSDYDAEVVDVFKGRKGVKVLTKAFAPSKIGDKIVFRTGQKSFHKDTEVLTERGWVLIPELEVTDKILSLFNNNGIYYSEYSPILEAHQYHFKGELYTMDSADAAYSVTAGHRIFGYFNNSWKVITAAEVPKNKFGFLSDDRILLSLGVKSPVPDVTEFNLTREFYDDFVHCIQVSGIGVIYTRFRGKTVWIGNSIISEIIPDEHMPTTESGEPLEVLLNHQSLPSRTNVSLPYELALGKVAAKKGAPLVLPGFTPPGKKWSDIIKPLMDEAGVSFKEKVFDPKEGRFLEEPISVGRGYIMKLHHVAECYDEQTEVLTWDGWKFWRDVTQDDLLATSDAEGISLKFEKPLHLVSYDYTGDLCSFSGKYVDYAVTPNHNMWQTNYSGNGSFSFKQASALHGSRFAVKQFGLTPICPGGPEHIKIGNLKLNWDDFCELTGWWLNEGCLNTGKSSVLVYQSSLVNPEKVERIKDLITRMGLKWSYYKVYGKIMGFHIMEKDIADYFGNYGSLCQFKKVPRELMTGPLSGCRRLLEAMVLGDKSRQETKNESSIRFTSTSKQLADDFQELCIRVGESVIIREDSNDKKKHAENPHYLTTWTCSRPASGEVSQVDCDQGDGGFSMLTYTGKVYCAEMNSGLLYVRRNGKPMLCGNSKVSSRGQGSYDQYQQPTKGGGESAQSKRMSGLETTVLLSSGAYNNIREASILRGQQNDEYWRQLKMGLNPKPPGIPFVWDKFNKMMMGAGIHPKDEGGGRVRLTPMTDKVLDSYRPLELNNAELVNMKDLSPIPGGLFDPALVSANAWGKITLPKALPNPAYEKSIRILLGLKKAEFEEILQGKRKLKFKKKKTQ